MSPDSCLEEKVIKLRSKLLGIAQENPITLVFMSVYFVLTVIVIIVMNLVSR